MSEAKRIALIACLLHTARCRARDEVVGMFCERMATIHNRGRTELEEIRERHRAELERCWGRVRRRAARSKRGAQRGWRGRLGGPPASEGAELSLRAEEAGSAGRRALLIRGGAEGRPEDGPEDAGGGPEGPTLGGLTAGAPWAPDWDALLERTIFRQEADAPFTVGRPSWAELGRLQSELRARDVVLLGLLYQHRCLSSAAIRALLCPGPGHRGAQRRLNELHADYRLLTRWQQLAPRRRGSPARRPYVYMLTARGAAVLAQAWDLDAKAVGRRAWKAAHHPSRVHHDLAVSDFFASLAVASAEWAGCGLYHWISDDSIRRNHELIKGSLSPDGGAACSCLRARSSSTWSGTPAPRATCPWSPS